MTPPPSHGHRALVLDGEETISKIAPEGAGSKEIGVDKIDFVDQCRA